MADEPEITITLPVSEEPDETADEVDELQEIVSRLETGQTQQLDILQRIEECQKRTTELLTAPNQSENPMLLQLSTQLTTLQSEVLALRSSMDLKILPIPNELETELSEPEAGPLIEEPSEGPLGEAPKPPRKNRFI